MPEIVEAVLADPTYGGRIDAPAKTLAVEHPALEYVVQYDETDHQFLCRILPDEGIASEALPLYSGSRAWSTRRR